MLDSGENLDFVGPNENDNDLNWALGLNRLSLRLMGVWPDESDEARGESLIVVLRVPFMILAMFLCLLLPQMYALVLVRNELPLVIDNLMTSSAAFTSCVKLFFIWNNKRVLSPVIKSVTSDWLRPNKCAWELAMMRREASRARMFTISGYVVLGGCYAAFAFAPLFGLNIRMLSNRTDYGERQLMTQSYYPYDYSQSPQFEVTHASQLVAGFFIGMSVSIPDNYFAALVFHASAQFQILGSYLENFIGADKQAARSLKRATFNERLGCLMRRHVHLMSVVSAIEKSFSFIIVGQILCMSVMVVCLGFQILGMFSGNGDKPSLLQMLTLFATLFTIMVHTLVDCFASETLATRSSGIFKNVYNCLWYSVPEQSTKDLIPMMAISKTPRQLTAGKIFYLSLATYCNLLKSIAGYISMLIAVNSR